MSASAVIRERIHARGPLTVADFMAIALYHPEHGYYARAGRRTGRTGDFFTNVDVSPLYGELLARQFAEMWRHLDPTAREPFDLVEAGAADGQLARDILDAAQEHDPAFYDAVRLHLVDASPTARATHPETLGQHAHTLVSTSARMPTDVHGVIYGNELLDALPVHSLVMTPDGLRECYVDLADTSASTPFVERVGPLSNAALEAWVDASGVTLQPGWRIEVNLSATAWITRACLSLHRGFLLLVDYGHERHQLYSETHAAGTLTTFSRHVGEQRREGTPPWLMSPGERDITAHVDLTAVRDTAESLGCRTLGILDQTYFLMAVAEAARFFERAEDPRLARAFKTLIMPGGLGSTQKVMIFSRHVDAVVLAGLSGRMRLT